MVNGLAEQSTAPLLEEGENGVSAPGLTRAQGPDGETALLSPVRGFYVWRIVNWSRAPARVLSLPFRACGYTWKLLCFPRGNEAGSSHVSLYLDGNEAEQNLQGVRHTTFKLMIKNQLNPSRSVVKDTNHRFSLKEYDWGFKQFMHQQMLKASEGFVVSDTLVVEVYIRLDSFESFTICESETGCVGGKNSDAGQERLKQQQDKNPADLLVRVSTERDMAVHTAEAHFDLVDHSKCRRFRVKKALGVVDFKLMLQKEYQVPQHSQRLWLWAHRQNATYRPLRVITSEEEEHRVLGDLLEKPRVPGHSLERLNLYMETPVAAGQELSVQSAPDVLLFFKFYDPQKQELRFAGKLRVPKSTIIKELAAVCSRWAGLEQGTDLEWYEEVKFVRDLMCLVLDHYTSCAQCELQDGDILIFQPSVPEEASAGFKFAHAPAYLRCVWDCLTVNFVRLDQAGKAGMTPLQVDLLRSFTYEETCRALATALQGLSASVQLFSTINSAEASKR